MDDQTAATPGGAESVPELVRVDPIAGELVTETFEYDGGRQVTVYVPPDRPEAVVFAGDGQLISQWGGYLEAADVPSTMIAGAIGRTTRTRWCVSRSTRLRPTRHGSRPMRASSSKTSAHESGRGSAS
jgi:hypothetical protein